MGQSKHRPDCWMASERRFSRTGENPDATVGAGLLAWKNERAFGVVGFARQRLHRLAIESVRFEKYQQLIPGQTPIGEDVEMYVPVAAAVGRRLRRAQRAGPSQRRRGRQRPLMEFSAIHVVRAYPTRGGSDYIEAMNTTAFAAAPVLAAFCLWLGPPATAHTDAPPSPGFHHLHLTSMNPDAAIAFYTK